MSEAVQAGLIYPARRINTGIAHHRTRVGFRLISYGEKEPETVGRAS